MILAPIKDVSRDHWATSFLTLGLGQVPSHNGKKSEDIR